MIISAAQTQRARRWQAEKDTEFLADHGEDEVGVRIREHGFMIHSPVRSLTAAALERMHRVTIWKLSPFGIEEAIDAPATCGKT